MQRACWWAPCREGLCSQSLLPTFQSASAPAPAALHGYALPLPAYAVATTFQTVDLRFHPEQLLTSCWIWAVKERMLRCKCR